MIRALSEFRSALEELRGTDLRALSDEGITDLLDEIERGARILESLRGRGLAELERRKAYATDGHLSAGTWLADRQGLSRRTAEGAVRRALALERMPEVAREFSEGEVSGSAVQVLAAAMEAAPEAFARSEPALVEAARTMSYGELHRVAETWRIAADPQRAAVEEDERHDRRRFDICPDANGMIGIHG
jgi:hypothetical protein